MWELVVVSRVGVLDSQTDSRLLVPVSRNYCQLDTKAGPSRDSQGTRGLGFSQIKTQEQEIPLLGLDHRWHITRDKNIGRSTDHQWCFRIIAGRRAFPQQATADTPEINKPAAASPCRSSGGGTKHKFPLATHSVTLQAPKFPNVPPPASPSQTPAQTVVATPLI